MKKIKSHI